MKKRVYNYTHVYLLEKTCIFENHSAYLCLVFLGANTCPRKDQRKLACISRDCKCDEVSDREVLALNLERGVLALGEDLSRLSLEPESH